MKDPAVKVKRGSYKLKHICANVRWNSDNGKYLCAVHRAPDMTCLECPYADIPVSELTRKAFAAQRCREWKEA